jgi:hypothetical protein
LLFGPTGDEGGVQGDVRAHGYRHGTSRHVRAGFESTDRQMQVTSAPLGFTISCINRVRPSDACAAFAPLRFARLLPVDAARTSGYRTIHH